MAGPNVERPELREAQATALQLRNTGVAVTVDIGDPADVHPNNKQDVGLRLGLAARAIAYGEKLVCSGPVFRQLTSECSELRVWFDHTGSGLQARGGALRGFTVAGKDGNFVPADARIENNTAPTCRCTGAGKADSFTATTTATVVSRCVSSPANTCSVRDCGPCGQRCASLCATIRVSAGTN